MKHERPGARSLVLSDGSTHVLTYGATKMEPIVNVPTEAELNAASAANIAERVDADAKLTDKQRKALAKRETKTRAEREARAKTAVRNAIEKHDAEEPGDDKVYSLDRARAVVTQYLDSVVRVAEKTGDFIDDIVGLVKDNDPAGEGCMALLRIAQDIKERSLKMREAGDDADDVRGCARAAWTKTVPALVVTRENEDKNQVEVHPASWNDVLDALLERVDKVGVERRDRRSLDNAIRYAAETWGEMHGVVLAKRTGRERKVSNVIKLQILGLTKRGSEAFAPLSPAHVEGFVRYCGPKTARDFAVAMLAYLDKLTAAAPPSKRATKAA